MADVTFAAFVDSLSVDTVAGSEKVPVVDSGTSKYQTVDLIKTYILAELTAAAAITPTTGDAFVVERAGTEGTFDLDALCDYVYDYLYDNGSVLTPVLSGDEILVERSGTKYRIDVDTLVTFVNSENGSLGSQITALSAATLAGSDEYVLSQGGTAAKVTYTNLAAEVHSDFGGYMTALSAVTTPVDANELFILQGSTSMKITLTELANDYMAGELNLEDFVWATATTTPSLAGDKLLMERSGTISEVDIDTIVTYAATGLQAGVLDFSALGASTPNTTDEFVLDDSGTPKTLTLAALETKLWLDYATYVGALTQNATVTASDKFYCIQAGQPKYCEPDELAAYFTVTDGDVIGPIATTEDSFPQWDSTTKTLKDGMAFVTTIRFDGSESDTNLVTEKSVSDAIEDIENLDIDGATDIGAALAGTDLIIVDDGAAGTNRKSAVSRIKTYMETVGHYETLWVPAAVMNTTTTSGAAALAKNEYTTNDIDLQYFAFDGAADERVQFIMPMPENWDRSTVKVKFFWSSATSSTTADTVEWAIKAGALSNSDLIDATLGTAVSISDALTADNGTDLQVTDATAALTVGGTPALGDLCVFEIYRDVSETDDMVEDAWLFGCWIQYQRTNTVAAW